MNTYDTEAVDPRVMAATRYAEQMHEGQFRKGSPGVPYVTHPIRTARRIHRAWPEAPPAVLAAAVLHDVVEKTPATIDDISDRFGPAVAELVRWTTKEPGWTETYYAGTFGHPKCPPGTRLIEVSRCLGDTAGSHRNRTVVDIIEGATAGSTPLERATFAPCTELREAAQ